MPGDGEEDLDAAITDDYGTYQFRGLLDRALVRRTPTPTDLHCALAAAKQNYNRLLARRAVVHYLYY